MKHVKSVVAATVLLSVTSATHAAIYSFTDRGLNYSIDDTNPLLAKATFKSVDVSAPITSTNLTLQDYLFGVIVNSFSLAIPKTTSGLSISPNGVATPSGSVSVQAQISGSYAGAYTYHGINYSHGGSWTYLTSFVWSSPQINIWDFPDSAPLLSNYIGTASGPTLFYDDLNNLDFGALSISSLKLDQHGNLDISLYGGIVPIPSSFFLFGSGVVGLAAAARRKTLAD